MKEERIVKRIERAKIAVVLMCLFILTIKSGVIGNAQETSNNYIDDQQNLVYFSLLTSDEASAQSYTTDNVNSGNSSISAFAEAEEEDTRLEDWMLDVDHEFWKDIRMTLNEEEVEEEEIELEDWMLDLSYWQ